MPCPATTVKRTARSPDALRPARRSTRLTAPPSRARSSRSASLDALQEHLDLAAAGQPDAPRHVVGDPVLHELRLARGHHLAGVLEHVRLHAPAGDRAAHLPGLRDREARAYRPWGR